jgi:hypothetical protein
LSCLFVLSCLVLSCSCLVLSSRVYPCLLLSCLEVRLPHKLHTAFVLSCMYVCMHVGKRVLIIGSTLPWYESFVMDNDVCMHVGINVCSLSEACCHIYIIYIYIYCYDSII